VEALQRAGVDADRRSLRVVPGHLDWQLEESRLTLAFDLPPGAYATSVLRELVLTDPDTISEDT
jgi:tRNA pseudouridine13 synthase